AERHGHGRRPERRRQRGPHSQVGAAAGGRPAGVIALRDTGVLNQGQANALLVKLSLNGTAGDVDKVQDFLDAVGDFLKAGILTQDQAEALLVAVCHSPKGLSVWDFQRVKEFLPPSRWARPTTGGLLPDLWFFSTLGVNWRGERLRLARSPART